MVVGIARTATCAAAEEGLDDGSIATADAGSAGNGSGGGGGRADLGGGSLPRRPAGIRGGGLLTIDGLEGWRGSGIAGGPRGGGGRRRGLLPSILPTTCCIGRLRSWSSGGSSGRVGIIGSTRYSPTPTGGILDRWCPLARGGFPLATRRRGRLLSLT